MRWGGVIILLFIIYHLLHLTFGAHVTPANVQFIEGDVYHNVVAGFQVWWIAAIYIIANLALGLPLYHGLWAMFNSLGLNHQRFNLWRRYFAVAFAVIITVGNISMPVAVLAGMLHSDDLMELDSKIPPGPLAQKWEYAKSQCKLVN